MSSVADTSQEAWIYRADFLTTKVYHQRLARLHGDIIELYKGDHLQLESTFPLASSKLSPIRSTECDVKPPGVNLFRGYVSGQIESKQLFILKIRLNKAHIRSHSKLLLGFDTADQAWAWHSAIMKCSGKEASNEQQDTCKSDRSFQSHDPGRDRSSMAKHISFRGQDTDNDVFLHQNSLTSDQHGESPARRNPIPPCAPSNPSSKWKSYFQWNGLACYREPEDGTYATCCAVPASPLTVFQHLVQLKDGTSAWTFFKNVMVLDAPKGDCCDMVFHANLSTADGALAWISAAGAVPTRDVVLQQNWILREEDGVIHLSFKSVEHPDAPPSVRGTVLEHLSNWTMPVRVEVQQLGFTIAPLNQQKWASRGMPPEEAPECMVTMLVRANPGGAFGWGSPVAPLLQPLGMLWMGALIRSITQVRDTLEQARFVEPLFCVFGDEKETAARSNISARASSLLRSRSDIRTAATAAAVAVAQSPRFPAATGAEERDTVSAVLAAVEEGGDGGEASRETAGLPPPSEEPQGWLNDKFYYSPDGSEFNVRSATYLSSKAKQPSAQPAFRLKAMEALCTDGKVLHISPFLPVVAHSSAPFLMPIHFTLPYGGRPMHLVVVFEAAKDPLDDSALEEDEPFARALAEFVAGVSEADDKRRSATLKMIPKLKEGSWVMRQAVGSTPVIIGNKIATSYHRGPNYLEVTVDIGSNSTAASVTNYVAGAVSSLAIWLGFVLEGRSHEHLPERLFGTVCLDHLDLKCAKFIDTSTPLPPLQRSGPDVLFRATARASDAVPSASTPTRASEAASAAPSSRTTSASAAAAFDTYPRPAASPQAGNVGSPRQGGAGAAVTAAAVPTSEGSPLQGGGVELPSAAEGVRPRKPSESTGTSDSAKSAFEFVDAPLQRSDSQSTD